MPIMKVEQRGPTTTIELTETEVKLLRRVLERASFIDTPVEEQPRIAAFAARALEQIADLSSESHSAQPQRGGR